MQATKTVVVTLLNANIRTSAAQIQEHIAQIEAHNTLISETEDGTLNDQNSV